MNMIRLRMLAAAALAVLAAAPSAAQIERSRGGHGPRGGGRSWSGGSGGGQRAARPASPSEAKPSGGPVVIKMRKMEVPAQQPRACDRADSVIRERPRAMPEAKGWKGRGPAQPRATQPPAEHTTIVRDQRVVDDIVREQRVEVVPRKYYWHRDHGVRYAHYYDGYHWYGFYHGPRFYWTRYWADHWWWYDPVYARWVFWHDGYWWWNGPRGAFFVYVDNSYYPYQPGGVVVKQPEVEAPPQSAPTSSSEGRTFPSPDKKREVQVYGDRQEAFLYDTTGKAPAFLTFLGASVKGVRFSGGESGKPLRILLDFNDGRFALFDKDGKPVDGSAAETQAAAPALPASAPPEAPPSPPPGNETAPKDAGQPEAPPSP